MKYFKNERYRSAYICLILEVRRYKKSREYKRERKELRRKRKEEEKEEKRKTKEESKKWLQAELQLRLNHEQKILKAVIVKKLKK